MYLGPATSSSNPSTENTVPKTATNDARALANRLTQALEAANPAITRTQLAAKLGVSGGAVSHWLNANRPCPVATVLRIAKITKAEPGWLLSGVRNLTAVTLKPTPSKASGVELGWGFREAPA